MNKNSNDGTEDNFFLCGLNRSQDTKLCNNSIFALLKV